VFVALYLILAPDGSVKRVEHVERAGLFLVFVDVTSSLDDAEISAAANLAGKLVWAAPQGARMVVLPVTSDVERGREFLNSIVPSATTSQERATLQAWRLDTGRKLRSDILIRAPEINRDPNQARSCVSDSLRRAQELIGSVARDDETEIILISDMIEDCADSLEGARVTLAKAHIKTDLDRLHNAAKVALVHLRGARVTGVIPTATSAPTGKNVVEKSLPLRPPVHELREYWRAILDRCGDDRTYYSVGADLPDRFLAEIPTEALEDDQATHAKSSQ
jgi:hypothetical protein